MGGIVELTVSEALAGQRLDNFILRNFRKAPKSLVYKQIRKGQVRVNGKRKKAEYRVVTDDRVRLPNLDNIIGIQPKNISDVHLREDPELEGAILFEDAHIICINKKSGWAVHSGSGVHNGIIERLRALRAETEYLELAHRLDRGTSGCLLIVKSREALLGIQSQFKERSEMTKWYSALCFNQASFAEKGVYDCTLKVTSAKGQQSAHTRFEVISQRQGMVLLNVELLTGRKHQIRQHCAALGIPIMGDGQYGDFAKNKLLPTDVRKRLMLHARKIQLVHPITQKKLAFEAPLPKEFSIDTLLA